MQAGGAVGAHLKRCVQADGVALKMIWCEVYRFLGRESGLGHSDAKPAPLCEIQEQARRSKLAESHIADHPQS